ncbi:MAG TPA: hypothetical protein VKS81_00030, partial [Bacteroidota bacterium]|nr:hypothetical protein [Bacteroidota bacterium]
LNTHGGQFIRDAARGRLKFIIPGNTDIVAVSDVAKGHCAALERGKPGERYILSGENMTFEESFTMAARVVGKPRPRIRVPVGAVKAVAKACDAFGAVTRKQPWITSELISGIEKMNSYSNEKARRELGFATTSVEAAMNEAYHWYSNHNLL